MNAPRLLARLLILAAPLVGGATEALAHCDTMNGPVVHDARHALETGDLTPVLKWVPADDEAEVEAAFARTVGVRGTSEAVREVADLHFFETVVRLHRMSEGVGYTGLKPATAVAPSVAAADRALETGDVGALADLLVGDLRAALAERFAVAAGARAHTDRSVGAGREFVRAYVRFTHLAEEVDAVARRATGHGGARAVPAAHAH